jgi:hypothetical protein
MSVIGRDFFDRQAIPYRDVPVRFPTQDGWEEQTIRIIPMSARDLNEMRDREERDFSTVAMVVCRCMVDENLARIFNEDEVERFMDRWGSGGIIKSLVGPLMELSGLAADPPASGSEAG